MFFCTTTGTATPAPQRACCALFPASRSNSLRHAGRRGGCGRRCRRCRRRHNPVLHHLGNHSVDRRSSAPRGTGASSRCWLRRPRWHSGGRSPLRHRPGSATSRTSSSRSFPTRRCRSRSAMSTTRGVPQWPRRWRRDVRSPTWGGRSRGRPAALRAHLCLSPTIRSGPCSGTSSSIVRSRPPLSAPCGQAVRYRQLAAGWGGRPLAGGVSPRRPSAWRSVVPPVQPIPWPVKPLGAMPCSPHGHGKDQYDDRDLEQRRWPRDESVSAAVVPVHGSDTETPGAVEDDDRPGDDHSPEDALDEPSSPPDQDAPRTPSRVGDLSRVARSHPGAQRGQSAFTRGPVGTALLAGLAPRGGLVSAPVDTRRGVANLSPVSTIRPSAEGACCAPPAQVGVQAAVRSTEPPTNHHSWGAKETPDAKAARRRPVAVVVRVETLLVVPDSVSSTRTLSRRPVLCLVIAVASRRTRTGP